MPRIKIRLMYHRPVRAQSFRRGFCHHAHHGFHLLKHITVAQDESRLVHEPGALDVVAVALQMASSTGPVHLKEEIQMMRLRIQYVISEDVYQVAQSCLHP